MQEEVKKVKISSDISKYIVSLVSATRNNDLLSLGASPRATLALISSAQAYAYIKNRDYVIPDDIQYLAPYILQHRLVLSSEAKINKVTINSVLEKLMKKVQVPIL